MLNLEKAYGTVGNLATEGVWFDGPMGTRHKIAMWQNKNHTALSARLLRERIRKAGPGNIDQEQLQIETLRDAAAHKVLLDWDGVTDEKDNPVAYSPEVGERIFRESPLYYNFVINCANEVRRYQDQETKDQEKNSSNVSDMPSTTKALPKRSTG